MALDNQIHLYSIDTGAFFTKKETLMYRKIYKLKKELEDIYILHKKKYIEVNSKKNSITKKDIETVMSDIQLDCVQIKKKIIKKKKKQLYRSFEVHSSLQREINQQYIKDKNVISIFDSDLVRSLNIKKNETTTDIIIIRVFYFKILENLMNKGFMFNGEKYIYLTSSAGQIRQNKTVFIKESRWKECCNKLTCGLSIEDINNQGGMNTNKYMSYLALTNSATDLWEDFDIDRCIVVDDFETLVTGTVDFFDDVTYEIIRKEMEVPITHTDGCGMILPSLSKKNFMLRSPWIKGLLASFDFAKFIMQYNCKTKIKDIYGKEYDIIKDNIQIILTKSQFKTHKYYKSWDDYKDKFKKHGCQAGVCNVEEDYISKTTINYQMIQTLYDMTDEEVQKLAYKSRQKIINIATSVKTMKEAFGIKKGKKNLRPFQQALDIYPELFTDFYTKESLKKIKMSLIKKYRSAKLEVDGKYTFLIPDLYAFCEYLFKGESNPKGLLTNGQISCNLYSKSEELDCLRSPHLYNEHAVRNNIVNDMTKEWFITNGIYTSCHDLISKILQFDNDGDKSLVVADKHIIKIAKETVKNYDVVPLYYNMKKAKEEVINSQTLYNGLIKAYTSGNIGLYSNDISKISNGGKMDSERLLAIKILTAENNFVIDYAKTLYKPTRPPHIKTLIQKYTKSKVPHFFIYAKDKKKEQVEFNNNSVVNKLEECIPNKRLVFDKGKFGKFQIGMLMSNSSIQIDKKLLKCYEKFNKTFRFKVNMEDYRTNNLIIIYDEVKNKLSEFGYSDIEITDMLVQSLYYERNRKSKEVLWFCYGDIVLENLKRNIGNKTYMCELCGERFKKNVHNQKKCKECQELSSQCYKTIICVDCKKEIVVSNKDNKTERCKECQREKIKIYDRERKRKIRLASKSKKPQST